MRLEAAVCLLVSTACSPALYAGPVSEHFDGARFHNQPEVREPSVFDLLRWQITSDPIAWPAWVTTEPSRPPPEVTSGDVRVTFVNHSTMLVQMDGVNLLTDPVWSDVVGPTSWIGPRRHHAPGVRFEDLPRIDAVVVSHDHYDHMDVPTLRRLAERDDPLVVSGLGNGRVLDEAGVKHHVELDWWSCTALKAGRICAVPAQHHSRRSLGDGDRALWVGFWIESSSGSVYFAGDTGLGPHFQEIRAKMSAPCVALLPIGAYLPRWFMSGMHMSPADAVKAHDVLGPRASIAMHFGTFEQSDEGMYQPAGELRLALAEGTHAPFFVPRVGEARTVRCDAAH